MTQTLEQGLMLYLASVGSTAGRTFGIRDFNSQVMMNAYSALERDGLQPALAALVERGILRQVSTTDYCVTAEGVRLMQAGKRTADQEPA
jgi:hypothetical protein